MKGLFPWIIEAMFGPPKPKCSRRGYCASLSLPGTCVKGLCASCCYTYCRCSSSLRPEEKEILAEVRAQRGRSS